MTRTQRQRVARHFATLGLMLFCSAAQNDKFQQKEFIKWAENLKKQSKQPEENEMATKTKCMQSNMIDDEIMVGHPKILCFISFSMPTKSLIQLSKVIQKIGGAFVIRGIPDEGVQMLSNKLYEIRTSGVYAPILIDPKAFESYEIEHVPTFVVFSEENYDKISGNISVERVLTKFVGGGDAVETSEELLRKSSVK